MSKSSVRGYIRTCLLYLVLQLVVMEIPDLRSWACGYVYINGLLLLPWEATGLVSWLLVGFVEGLLVDVWTGQLGLHALASVLIVYFRTIYLGVLFPPERYEISTQPSVFQLGWLSYALYICVLASLYHGVVVGIDATGSQLALWEMVHTIWWETLSVYVVAVAAKWYWKMTSSE